MNCCVLYAFDIYSTENWFENVLRCCNLNQTTHIKMMIYNAKFICLIYFQGSHSLFNLSQFYSSLDRTIQINRQFILQIPFSALFSILSLSLSAFHSFFPSSYLHMRYHNLDITISVVHILCCSNLIILPFTTFILFSFLLLLLLMILLFLF